LHALLIVATDMRCSCMAAAAMQVPPGELRAPGPRPARARAGGAPALTPALSPVSAQLRRADVASSNNVVSLGTGTGAPAAGAVTRAPAAPRASAPPGAAKDAFAPGADVVVVPVSRAPLPATAAGEGSAAGNA